jgi:hypothetical protein
MKRYRTLITSDAYQAEIYDGCYTTVEERNDGERLRISRDGTYWHGNTGGFRRYVMFIVGRNAVRAYWRKLRKLQMRALHNGDSPHDCDVLTLEYNW